jgi:acyl-CoA dehydrogenase
MSDLDTFRAETRAWLEANCPPEMRQPVRSEADICWGGKRFVFQSEAQKLWLQRMGERGWTVPDLAQGIRRRRADPAQAKVLREEMASADMPPPLQSFGIWMLGPALLKYGSEAQKRQYLPPIARGEIRWCQGYSEPNAGSTWRRWRRSASCTTTTS